MPGFQQAWPKSAACWSPAMPLMGMPFNAGTADTSPKMPLLARTPGSTSRGMRRILRSSSSQPAVRILSRRVRAALETSVAWTRPPVSCQSSQVSTVPKASSPFSARRRAPGTWSRSHASFVPLKYGSSSRPVFCRNSGSSPRRLSFAQRSAVRRSCQTMARCSGRPVHRSQSRVVSRWLVRPRAATSRPVRLASATAPSAVRRVDAQRSSGSCSTQPGLG